MKHMNRILALALALMMVLGLVTTAYADDGYKVTINGATGHTYQIYQIFTGELSTNDAGEKVLSNIKYGTDYVPEGKSAGDLVPDTELENLDPESIVPTGAGAAMTTNGDVATAEGLVAGYYMIKDVTDPLPEGDTASAVIFRVVGDTTVTSKHIGTTIVKKVQDINDSTGEQPKDGESTWIDSADYDIGDTVPFQSTANFAGLNNYETYKVVFTDTMAKGLTYNADMAVLVNGVDKTSAFTISTKAYEGNDADYAGGTVITVSCDDITALTDANTAEIVLKYTAELNSNAKLGAPGNPNKIKVSTKPDGTGETPEDVNIVFTYKVVANKYANEVAEGNELNGAGFTLYKWYVNAELEAGGEWKAIGEEIVGEAFSTFEWKGIDDGKYKLEETTTPEGFNTIDPIEFEVVAGHTIVAAEPVLESLNGGNLFTGEVETGAVSGDVVNNAGTVLPETGGIGTTIFYILGGMLAVAAVVLLVTKKRMTTAE